MCCRFCMYTAHITWYDSDIIHILLMPLRLTMKMLQWNKEQPIYADSCLNCLLYCTAYLCIISCISAMFCVVCIKPSPRNTFMSNGMTGMDISLVMCIMYLLCSLSASAVYSTLCRYDGRLLEDWVTLLRKLLQMISMTYKVWYKCKMNNILLCVDSCVDRNNIIYIKNTSFMKSKGDKWYPPT